MATRLGEWIDERSGWISAWRGVLLQPVPPLSWGHVLGTATLVALLVLTLTGILLALFYVPSPEQAHAAVDYVAHGLPYGSFLRDLHHFGASALVILSLAHAVRVVVHGAYKYPREFTWFTGVGLLLLVFAFGFTGSLLPWDQNAFWATSVRMGVVRVIPGAGRGLAELLLGGDEISALTLVRFFVVHIWILPAATVVLVFLHLRLVHRHGVSALPDRNE